MYKRTSAESIDPLPRTIPQLEDARYEYYKDPPSTLGELVVTDPRDPFVWLNLETASSKQRPTEKGKQLLWITYRMNGNFPKTDADIKWRDTTIEFRNIFRNISQIDLAYLDKYQRHLARLDAEGVKGNSAETVTPQSLETIPIDEPQAKLAFAAIKEHQDIVSGKVPESGIKY